MCGRDRTAMTPPTRERRCLRGESGDAVAVDPAPILDDEAVSRNLGDAEARLLFEWLVERAELAAAKADTEVAAERAVAALSRSGALDRQVRLALVQAADQGAGRAARLGRALDWPLPPADIDAWSLTGRILRFEDARAAA